MHLTMLTLCVIAKCYKKFRQYEEIAAENGVAPPGSYRPDCKEDGSFRAKQCNPSTASCWCVNTVTGEEIPGTAKQTFIANVDCSQYEGNIQSASLGKIASQQTFVFL